MKSSAQTSWLVALATAILLLTTACSAGTATLQPSPSATKPPLPSRTPPPTATTIPSPTPEEDQEARQAGRSLLDEQGELFAASGACASCHTGLEDEGGDDVSLDTQWRSTMMANSARDPYWQAAVKAETLANPSMQASIEKQCATCHMPMAHVSAQEKGEESAIFAGEGFLNAENDLHELAMDGVSCSLCHQIREQGLGGPPSYSGGFLIDTELRPPDRVIFGPYTVADDQADIMQSASGFRPEQGIHITESALCASCHTLYSPYVDASGEIAGEFPQQVPYLEWYYSSFRRTQSCQDCHMPEAEGGVKIATSSQVLRSPFAQHAFVGGNAYVLQILRDFADELGATATTQQFESTLARTVEQLQEETAKVSLENLRLAGPLLYADVVVENLAGHKFPTGFPARRAWLRTVVTDSEGQVVFDSGSFRQDGFIAGNANDENPAAVEQHYTAIVQPEQVQIYEALPQNTERRLTTLLFEAASYRKDNRLLPAGFEKAAPYEDLAVRGEAREDEDFQGGGDRVEYIVNVGSSPGPFQVKVELLYQSISFRWVENLRAYEATRVDRFLGYTESRPNLPVVVASATAQVGD